MAEANVVYLSPTGTDAVPCSRALPCKGLRFSVQQASEIRSHLVFATGMYDLGFQGVNLDTQSTTATRLFLHGGGATLTGGSSDGGLTLRLPATLRDLEIVNPTVGSSQALYISSSAVLERVRLRGYNGLANVGQVTARRLTIDAQGPGIANTGALTIDGAMIVGGTTAIWSRQGSVDVTNLLAYGASGIAIDIEGSGGSIAFSTIYSTAQGTDPAGVRCAIAPLTIRSSIVWTPTSPTPRVGVVGSCILTSTIVGPIGVAGAMNTDPSFVSANANNFHLNGGSPARDAVDAGPAMDFEGDPRPRGARFDIGADEAP